MKTNNLLPLVLVLAGVFFASSLPAQEITSNAAYKARMDSLSRAFSAVVNEWNEAIPPHFRKAMQLEKEAEAHPEIKSMNGTKRFRRISERPCNLRRKLKPIPKSRIPFLP